MQTLKHAFIIIHITIISEIVKIAINHVIDTINVILVTNVTIFALIMFLC